MKISKIYLILPLLTLFSNAFGQYGEIRGTVTDYLTGKTLPGATVTWTDKGAFKGTITNEKGEYLIKPLLPGAYNLEISFVTYKRQPYASVVVSAEKATYLDAALMPDNELPVVIIQWEPPIIDKGNASTMTTLTTPEISQAIERDVVSLITRTPGVFQKDEGGAVNVRGSRENNTLYVVNGIKMTGDFSLPKSAIAEISVLTGGVPAQFGDATGGVVIITTKSYKQR